jgi:hypothetical protein
MDPSAIATAFEQLASRADSRKRQQPIYSTLHSIAFQHKPAFEQQLYFDYSNRNASRNSNHFDSVLDDLQSLENGWDGYNSIAPNPKIIVAVREFIDKLPSSFVGMLNSEDILPNPNGTITLQWISGSNKISIEFGESSSSYYTDIDGRYLSGQDFISIIDKMPFDLFTNFNVLLSSKV